MNWLLAAAICLNFSSHEALEEHKFYVSNTIIEYNRTIGNFEVTSKLFTDDLELALTNYTGRKIVLSGIQDASVDIAIDEYLKKHFKVTFNDKPIFLSYVGHESEVDLTYVYFEIIGESDFSIMSVESSVLLEIYPEQKNIIDVRKDGWTKTAILTKDKQREAIYR